MSQIRTQILALCSLVILVSCDSVSKNEDFSLTIPESRWALSKYCGDVTPELPENPITPHIFERPFLNEKLTTDGLLGWMHGVVPSYKQFVFTYRMEDPSDFMAFFKAEQFALIPGDGEIAATLAGLKRHDKVRLKGAYFENASPLGHIRVTGIEIVKTYEHATDNSYAFDIAQLNGKTTFDVFGMVHATINSEQFGRAIVVEHGDLMLPLAVPAKHNEAAAPLYRGDIVNVSVKVSERPHGPPHMELNPDVDQAVRIVDPILNCHGLETSVTGYLTKFHKSPAISVDVYAIRVVDANGQARNYTLFPDTTDNDEFTNIFMGLSAKAKEAWDSAEEEPTVVRNFWKKETVKVTAKGKLNVVSSEQANAQIYIKSVDDLTLTIE